MKRILVDITAATEYAHKLIEEDALGYAKSNFEEYNATHKRKLETPTVDHINVTFEGLCFGYGFNVNNGHGQDSACLNILIDDFIVTTQD